MLELLSEAARPDGPRKTRASSIQVRSAEHAVQLQESDAMQDQEIEW